MILNDGGLATKARRRLKAKKKEEKREKKQGRSSASRTCEAGSKEMSDFAPAALASLAIRWDGLGLDGGFEGSECKG